MLFRLDKKIFFQVHAISRYRTFSKNIGFRFRLLGHSSGRKNLQKGMEIPAMMQGVQIRAHTWCLLAYSRAIGPKPIFEKTFVENIFPWLITFDSAKIFKKKTRIWAPHMNANAPLVGRFFERHQSRVNASQSWSTWISEIRKSVFFFGLKKHVKTSIFGLYRPRRFSQFFQWPFTGILSPLSRPRTGRTDNRLVVNGIFR